MTVTCFMVSLPPGQWRNTFVQRSDFTGAKLSIESLQHSPRVNAYQLFKIVYLFSYGSLRDTGGPIQHSGTPTRKPCILMVCFWQRYKTLGWVNATKTFLNILSGGKPLTRPFTSRILVVARGLFFLKTSVPSLWRINATQMEQY